MPEPMSCSLPVADNPIFAIGDRAAALRAAGVDVITLAAGEPERSPSDAVLDAAAAAIRHADTHHYGSAAGLAELRAEIAGSYPHGTVAAGGVQVAVGAKHALHLALGAVAGPRDDVLVVRPSWPGHVAGVEAIGANAVSVPAGPEGTVDVSELERARTPRVKALVIANPANPSGVVHPPQLVRELARWCRDHDIWFVSDEAYGGLVYDAEPRSTLETVADASRLIVVDGVSKLHAMTGWRVGWLIAPDPILAAARRQVSATITHVPVVTQHAALAAVRDRDSARRTADEYREARDALVDRLQTIPGVRCPRPAGGMFAFPDVSGLLRTGRWQGSAGLATWLLDEARVAVVPGGVFGAEDHLRVSFAVDHDRLVEAADRLVRALT